MKYKTVFNCEYESDVELGSMDIFTAIEEYFNNRNHLHAKLICTGPHTCKLTEAQAREMLGFCFWNDRGETIDRVIDTFRNHGFLTAPEPTALEEARDYIKYSQERYGKPFNIEDLKILSELYEQAIKEGK